MRFADSTRGWLVAASLGFAIGSISGITNAQTPPVNEKAADPPPVTPEPTTPNGAPTAPRDGATPETPAPGSATPGALPVVPPVTTPAPVVEPPPAPPPKKEEHWYDKLRIRGYTQLRFNRLPSFDVNDSLNNDQGDKSIGDNQGFFIRRARVILFGDVHEHVYVYLQPDFASSIGTQLNVPIMRDWYADISIDKAKEFRFRVGQSKVPFGFENMQSSQNRLPLDRNDATNSGVKDERDIGVFFYWAPAEIRARFKHLVDAGLKGSGDYGVVGLGVYNGQTANRPERNDNKHVVGRVTWPFKFGEQFLEVGVGGYYGKYNVTTVAQGTGATMTTFTLRDGENDLLDARGIGSVMLYPQPIGFVAEYNFGKGPSLGVDEPTVIASRKLQGGYAQAMVKIDDVGGTTMIPYVRYAYYDGGKKFEDNAPHYKVKELEMGIEWQVWKALEITGAYMMTDRSSSRFPYNQLQGHLTRVQVQFNY
ncbi:MAG: porin [Polyangiaceae bacterium]